MHPLAQLDHRYIWHPFTQMRDWLRAEPVVITHGKGSLLYDTKGREYLDANSSIWTNLHGHAHPKINSAIQRQLKKIAHSSALGLANEPASLLAEKLVGAAQANPEHHSAQLSKVFFSDNGSTAMEVALKLAYEYTRRTSPHQPRFLSLSNAYHGDTIGAVSLGHIDLFHSAYKKLLFKADKVAAPYCYRCPFNKAKPERTDARLWAKCNRECVGAVATKFSKAAKQGRPCTTFALEPLMQGAAGMVAHPAGYLREINSITKEHNALLICDEVMTGFGRCSTPIGSANHLFAFQTENAQPDFVALAKGLTGGYLPMAATLTAQRVFDAFLGEYDEFKTFFHGHSYTANQVGASAAKASMDLLQTPRVTAARQRLSANLAAMLNTLWDIPTVGDIRQVGTTAGIELVRDWRTKEPFPLEDRIGFRVCEELAKLGVLTRPIGSVLVVMPPYCTIPSQIQKLGSALHIAIGKITLRTPSPHK